MTLWKFCKSRPDVFESHDLQFRVVVWGFQLAFSKPFAMSDPGPLTSQCLQVVVPNVGVSSCLGLFAPICSCSTRQFVRSFFVVSFSRRPHRLLRDCAVSFRGVQFDSLYNLMWEASQRQCRLSSDITLSEASCNRPRFVCCNSNPWL